MIYFSGVTSFDAMLNVSKVLRGRLAEAYTLERPEVVTEQVSADGTRKWLIRLPPHAQDRTAHGRGSEVEVVYIPENDRGTLCISSQVGCTLTCAFCIPARRSWCATSPPPRSRRRWWSHATGSATIPA